MGEIRKFRTEATSYNITILGLNIRTLSLIAILVLKFKQVHFTIGIKHGFSCINIRQVPREVLKTEAGGRGFQHLLRDLANVNALKNHVPLYYCINTESICFISRYFLHYFVSSFHQCLANAISTVSHFDDLSNV